MVFKLPIVLLNNKFIEIAHHPDQKEQVYLNRQNRPLFVDFVDFVPFVCLPSYYIHPEFCSFLLYIVYLVHNVEFQPGQGGKLARSAGSYVQLAAKEGRFATLKLPSGETRQVLVTCSATIGAVSNSDHQLVVSGKAGRSRWLGRRPRVRGVAMNPVDHPMGGGEGRSSGGHPRSRKGLPAKGYKTRAPKKYSDKYIIEKRKK